MRHQPPPKVEPTFKVINRHDRTVFLQNGLIEIGKEGIATQSEVSNFTFLEVVKEPEVKEPVATKPVETPKKAVK